MSIVGRLSTFPSPLSEVPLYIQSPKLSSSFHQSHPSLVLHPRVSICMSTLFNGSMCVSSRRVNHSKNAIVKPQGPTPQEVGREVEEAMKRIKEASRVIAITAITNNTGT